VLTDCRVLQLIGRSSIENAQQPYVIIVSSQLPKN